MKVFYSILITLAVSFLLGLGAWFFHISFWGTTIFAFVIQLIAFYMLYSYLLVKGESYFVQQLEALAKQSILVTCAYCKHATNVPVRLDLENELVCPKCNKVNAVIITAETAQKTLPVSTEGPAKLPQNVINELAAAALARSKQDAATITPA